MNLTPIKTSIHPVEIFLTGISINNKQKLSSVLKYNTRDRI